MQNENLKQKEDFFLENTYLAYIDIMGFSSFIKSIESHQNENFKTFLSLWHNNVIRVEYLATDMATSYHLKRNDNGEMEVDFPKSPLAIQVFSDCILIWTKSTSNLAFKKLISVSRNIFLNSFEIGFPVRGAISKGWFAGILNIPNPFTNLNISIDSYYGSALVKAFQLESSQEWSGIALDIELSNNLDKNTLYDLQLYKNICYYDYYKFIKVNSGISSVDFVIDWTNEIKNFTKEDFEKKFSMNGKEIDGSVKQKIENTYAFYKEMTQNPIDEK